MIDTFTAKQLLGEQFISIDDEKVGELIRLAYIVARIAVDSYIQQVSFLHSEMKVY